VEVMVVVMVVVVVVVVVAAALFFPLSTMQNRCLLLTSIVAQPEAS